MSKRVCIVVDETIKNQIIEHYKFYEQDNSNEYVIFFAKRPDLVITVFKSKRESEFKVLFVGDNSLVEARTFDPNAEEKAPKTKVETNWLSLEDQIGSDEVGTGDFFGPICVCAAYVTSKDINYIIKLGVKDSKKLSDDQIKDIAKRLIKKIPYSQVSLDNVKYNELVERKMNMNEMKVKLHNQVLLNLKKKYPSVQNFFIDEFTSKKHYFDYLKDTKDIVENLNFKTKGESYFPSVAVGSIIARYSFLQKMEKLSKKYGMEFPHGSSSRVDKFAKNFTKKFGLAELRKVVKTNFINYQKIIEDLQ